MLRRCIVLEREVFLLRVPHLLRYALAARDQVLEIVCAIVRLATQIAAEHVAGYAIYNDGSVRDWQQRTTQWIAGKPFSAEIK